MKPMRLLFHLTLSTMLRHFDGVLRGLADRGHTVRIATPEGRRDVGVSESLRGHERISFVSAPAHRGDEWAHPIFELRAFRDYLRYLDGRFNKAPKLRARAIRRMVRALTHDERGHFVAHCPHCRERIVDDDVGRLWRGLGKTGLTSLNRLFALMERTVPSDPAIETFLRAESPDLVLVTPLINLGSRQADYVKSAQFLGIPVGFPVFSWDNLTNKGLIHVIPDRMFVWNNRQLIEATKMHGVPADRVVVTGAPRFDEFFGMSPGTSRSEFCSTHGFDVSQPIVTYLCSSEFVAGHESDFIRRWIDEIRRAPGLRSCNVLVRPHPREQSQWKGFAAPPGVAVAFPHAMNADQSLFDCLTHSAAVVGLNTSAQLEAGIVGRPVLTILAPEFADGQQGTLHFQYLLKERGGFVEVAPDFDVHRQQLADAVAGRYDAAAIRSFILRFLRPHGLDRPATPIMVEAIEAFAASARLRANSPPVDASHAGAQS